jgi:hypothetical protein
MTRVNLTGASAAVTLDSSGNGTAKVGPISAREIWYPANVHVAANIGNVTNEAQCIVYMGETVNPNNFRDGTLSGSSGDSTDALNADEIKIGQYIWAVWSNGDAGAQATMAVTGEKDI